MGHQGIIGGIIFILIGLFSIICTIKKPSFFWESRKAKRMRKILGDKITSVFYIVVGILAFGSGSVAFLGGLFGVFAG